MGNFIALCPAKPARALVGSGRVELFADYHPVPDQGLRACAACILAGDMLPGEYPDASVFVTAWQNLCAIAVKPFVCVEIYVDDEQFPESFDFVWRTALGVPGGPVSMVGGATVGLCNDVAFWIAAFEKLDLVALRQRTDQRYDEEIAMMLDVMRDPACAEGMLIFWAE